jgi:photosystem II stability/assembly factor-like uncharacterized protein
MNSNILSLVIACAVFILSVSKSDAQWIQMGGPDNGSIKQLVTIGNKIFAGTNNGVYLSTDSGSSWKSFNAGLSDDKQIDALVTNGRYIFAAIFWRGIYRSCINDSCKWEPVTKFSEDYVYSLAAENNTVLAGMSSGRILISTDNGENWSLKDTIIGSFSSVYSIAMRDSLILVIKGVEMYISTDNGTRWNSPWGGMGEIYANYCIHIGDSAFFTTNSYGWVFRSTDTGLNWTRATNGLKNARIVTLTSEGNAVYGGSSSNSSGEIPGVFKSSDNGENWTPLDSASLNKNVISIALIGDRIIAGTEHDGVYHKRKDGNNWIQVCKGLYPAISCLLVPNCELFAGTEHGLFKSTDGCKTWIKADSIKSNSKIMALALCGNTIFAATGADGIYRSVDNGTTWHKTNAFDSTLCITVNDSFILAGNTRGIQLCRVDDSLWTWVDKKFPTDGMFSIAAHDSMVFAGGYLSGAFRSTNYGKTWESIDTTTFPASNTRSFAICGDTVFASLLLGGIYRSTDNGVSWIKLKGLSSSGYGDIVKIDSTVVVSTSSGIYYSVDYGSTWYKATSGLENKNVCSLFSAGNELYAGTELDGIWHRSVSDLMTPVIEPKKRWTFPKGTNLKIRFYGSMSHQALIEFTLSEPVQVKIKLYDIRGREIISPVNGCFGAGTHSIKWNTSDIASGFYTAKMYIGVKNYMTCAVKIQ